MGVAPDSCLGQELSNGIVCVQFDEIFVFAKKSFLRHFEAFWRLGGVEIFAGPCVQSVLDQTCVKPMHSGMLRSPGLSPCA